MKESGNLYSNKLRHSSIECLLPGYGTDPRLTPLEKSHCDSVNLVCAERRMGMVNLGPRGGSYG